jgi:peptide deformylase
MNTLLEKNNPILREQAAPIDPSEFNSHWLKQLIQDMFDIMKEKGAVGVAAPQIGVSKRVIVFSTGYSRSRNPEIAIPDTALINPTLKVISQETEAGYEGCLNCGDVMGEVPRSIEIEYSGYDINGNLIKKRATGLEARILQHEIDHLDGILFLDKVENEETLITYEELKQRQA